MHLRIKEKVGALNILTIYNITNKKEIGEVIINLLEEYINKSIIIGGDFNIRVGEKMRRKEAGKEEVKIKQ